MPTLDFATCQEVDEDLMAAAFAPATSLSDTSPRERSFALIERMAEVARPRQGAFRVLFVFAKMAKCDWLDGSLELRLKREAAGTTIEALLDDGLSLNRLHTPLHFAAPFEEFAMAIDHRPQMLAPLAVSSREPGNALWLRASTDRVSSPEEAVSSDVLQPAHRELTLQYKPTRKVAAVRIPREAYRDADEPDNEPEQQTPEKERGNDQPTIAPAASSTRDGASDDIDSGWE